jgi:hypothetical protein
METTLKKILSFLIACMILTACEKEIVFTGNTVNQKIVVNSYVSTDSVLAAHISKSRFFLSNQNGFESIDNAEVSVFVNHTFKEKLISSGNGMYRGTYLPISGDTLRLKINAQGFDEAESNTVILPPSNILRIDTTLTVNEASPIYVREDEIGGYSYYVDCNIKIDLRDQGHENNYYRITLIQHQETYVEEEDTLYVFDEYLPFVLEGLDNQSNNFIDLIEGGENYGIQQLIADDLFNGKDIRFKLKTNFHYVEIVPGYEDDLNTIFYRQEADTESLIINFQTITRAMYLYLLSKEKAQDVMNGVFTEPVQIYNNITNGIGIFGSYTNNKQHIKIY